MPAGIPLNEGAQTIGVEHHIALVKETRMKVEFNRREFVSSLAALPLAVKAAFAAQDPTPSFPIIDTTFICSTRRGPRALPTHATCREAESRRKA